MSQEDKTSRRECDESGSRETETGAQSEAQVRLPVRGYCPFTHCFVLGLEEPEPQSSGRP